MVRSSKQKSSKQKLADKTIIELKKLLKEAQSEFMKLKLDLKMGKLNDVHIPFKKRKEIARIKTAISNKQLVISNQ